MTAMRSVEVVIVGGGPAGSAAAQRLRAAGVGVLVLDRARFPRRKLCAGWITPQVVSDLELDVGSYPHGFLSFDRLCCHVKGLRVPVRSRQHSIRRYEFDAWLLERSGAEVIQHTVKSARREGPDYIIDETFRCRYLIGAGGTACPVRRFLSNALAPRVRQLQTMTLELEFPCDWQDGDCHLWFFERGLPGYSWYVPKANRWLNVGLGAMASRLNKGAQHVWQHWRHFAATLQRQFGIHIPREPTGYSYYLRGGHGTYRVENALLAGDSAGLATRDLCEGIGPAIRSGQRAADAIIHGTTYDLDITGTSLGGIFSRALEWAFTRGVDTINVPSEAGRRLS